MEPKSSPEYPVTYASILTARATLSQTLAVTPVSRSEFLSERYSRNVFLKWESAFRTGAFKERGVLYFLSCLSEIDSKRGVCAASAGNHALALSFHASRLGIPCTIVMPRTAPLVKVKNTESYGARVILEGGNFDEARGFAEELSTAGNTVFVPAFDDPNIIAGQGTAGLELIEQVPELDLVVVPVGGGGLISGVALAVKTLKPNVNVLGAQSQWATEAQARRLQHPGHHSRLRPPSVADGIAVKGRGKLTSLYMKRYVDRLVQLSEPALAKAVVELLEGERALVEGAGAAGVAALNHIELPSTARNICVIISGGNIDVNILGRLIQADMADRGRLIRFIVTAADRPGSLHTITEILAEIGANILEVSHDRSFSKTPGAVEISFLLELRDRDHKRLLFERFGKEEIPVRESNS